MQIYQNASSEQQPFRTVSTFKAGQSVISKVFTGIVAFTIRNDAPPTLGHHSFKSWSAWKHDITATAQRGQRTTSVLLLKLVIFLTAIELART